MDPRIGRRTLRAVESWDFCEEEDYYAESGEAFSDGVGYISYELMYMLCSGGDDDEWGDGGGGGGEVASAVQLRCGGYKGMA